MKRAVCLGLAVGAAVTVTATVGFRVGAATPLSPPAPLVHESTGAQRVPSSAASSSARPHLTLDAAPSVSLFITGWLSTEPGRRRALIDATCSARLAELLLMGDPAKVPDAQPEGPPALVRRGLGVESYAQRLSDGTAIVVDVVLDPGRPSGWTVTSVRPGSS
jgi:hypothetical protein